VCVCVQSGGGRGYSLNNIVAGCTARLQTEAQYQWAIALSTTCANVWIVDANDGGAPLLQVPLRASDKVRTGIDDLKGLLLRLFWAMLVLSVVQVVSCWPDVCWPRLCLSRASAAAGGGGGVSHAANCPQCQTPLLGVH